MLADFAAHGGCCRNLGRSHGARDKTAWDVILAPRRQHNCRPDACAVLRKQRRYDGCFRNTFSELGAGHLAHPLQLLILCGRDVWQTFNSDSAVTICLANRDDAIPAAASNIVNIIRGSVRQQGFRTNDAERDTCLIEWRIGRGHWIGMLHRLGCKGKVLRQRRYAQDAGAKSIAHVRQWYAASARAGAPCNAQSEQTHAAQHALRDAGKHIPRKRAPSNTNLMRC